MFGWLSRLANEGHRSEEVAKKFHMGQAIAYGLLIVGYVCMIAYHVAAAGRHDKAAKAKKKERPCEDPPRFV